MPSRIAGKYSQSVGTNDRRHAARVAPHPAWTAYRGSRPEPYWLDCPDCCFELLSTWFLQYFFMSLFDMPELLAFCWAMQSFNCSFFAARLSLLVSLLLVSLLLELLDGAGAEVLGY
jgi:hypothetical protein